MDRVERMIEETKASSVALMTFIRIAVKDRSAVFCFFEGEDEKYYSVRIAMHFRDRSWHPISCGGKSAVIELHAEISSRQYYRDIGVAFFVDKDFDAPLTLAADSNIYETPCYSVENFYCDNSSIKRIMSAEFGISEQAGTNEYFNSVFNRIIATQADFHNAIEPVNRFIKAHRSKENVEGRARLNLQNVNLDQLVKIRLDGVDAVVSPEDLNEIFPDSYPIGELGLDGPSPFNGGKLCYELRGKYELEFVRCVLSKLREACSKKEHQFYRRGYSVKLNLTKANAISELSQYATTPPCLHAFLSRIAGRPCVAPPETQPVVAA